MTAVRLCARYLNNWTINRLHRSASGVSCAVSGKYNPTATFATRNTSGMSGDVEGLLLGEVIEEVEKLGDVKGAESWDNVGLLLEPFTPVRVKSVLLTNDLTENVMEEAVNGKINMIISYHPPLFAPIKKINGCSWKERIVACCLENKIAVYSPHTAWDATSGGVTDWLAEAFEGHYDPSTVIPIVKPTTSGIPSSSHGEEGTNGHLPSSSTAAAAVPQIVGMGRILTIAMTTPPPLTLAKCVELVKRRTGLVHVRLATARGRTHDSPVSSIALVPGSGGSLLKTLLERTQKEATPPVDLFLTGEMFHHDILDAVHRGVSVILTNHSDSERGFLKVVAAKLRSSLGDRIRVVVSSTDKDPLRTV